jgi:hypothetical protein
MIAQLRAVVTALLFIAPSFNILPRNIGIFLEALPRMSLARLIRATRGSSSKHITEIS